MGILTEPINEIGQGLDPESDKFILKVAFIPSEEYMQEFVYDIKTVFDNKFSFISEIGSFLGNILGVVIEDNPEPPEFKVNLPGGKWGSGSVSIIDFSIFEDYRPFILNFIRVILWIPFLIKLYKRLPSLVYQ